MIQRDTTWAQACLLAALSMSTTMLRESVHSHRTSPVTALIPALVLVATLSSGAATAVLAVTVLIGRIWLLEYQPLLDISTLTHTIVTGALYFVAREIRGPLRYAFFVFTAAWPPLWTHTEFGHWQESAAALGVLAVWLARTRWRRSRNEQRAIAGALFSALAVFGGTVHVPLMAVTLSAFWVIQAPSVQVEQ